MTEYTCPVCFEPCSVEIVEGVPVYSCINHHDLSEFDIQEVVDDFEEWPTL